MRKIEFNYIVNYNGKQVIIEHFTTGKQIEVLVDKPTENGFNISYLKGNNTVYGYVSIADIFINIYSKENDTVCQN